MSEPVYIEVALLGMQDEQLTYRAPDTEDPAALIGCRVLVPLGNRRTVGVIVGYSLEAPGIEVRHAYDVLDSVPVLTSSMLHFTRQVGFQYLCSWPRAMQAALPAGLLDVPKLTVEWTGPELEGFWPPEVLKSRQSLRVCRYLAGRGTAKLKDLKGIVGKSLSYRTLRRLEALDLIKLHEHNTADQSRSLTLEIVELSPDFDLEEIPAHYKARRRVISLLKAQQGSMPWPQLREEARVSRNVLDDLANAGFLRIKHAPK
ncbi:hypothetical protein GF324_00940, partial [bacterium]|nr:hypothetical protein [bacterium]